MSNYRFLAIKRYSMDWRRTRQLIREICCTDDVRRGGARHTIGQIAIAILLSVGMFLVGCTAKPNEDELVKANLMQIAKGYLMVLSYNRRPPRDMEELRSAVDDLHRLQMGAPPDEALVSPRDKQPLVIILGADSSDPGDAILVYEQEGLNGYRWIVTMGADVNKLSDEEFPKATFAKNHKPKGT